MEHILTEFADGVEAVVAARVDSDSDIDFFSAAFNLDEIAWWENGGDGQTWTPRPITFDVRLATDVWTADLDGDGDSDAVSASGFDGAILWYENRASGSQWTGRVISPAAAECVTAADLDQDGDVDVVAGTAWFENDGGAPPGWMHRVVSTTADFATSVYAADLDGDADADILSSSFFDNTIAWYENDGGSPPAWTERPVSTTAQGARSVFAADLDDDGDMDVLSANQNDAQVVWHVNEGYADADRDGMRDELDCAPADAGAFRVPREVSGVRLRSGSRLDWNSTAAGSGSGARYDVVRGSLPRLPPGSGPPETCLANDATARSLTDTTDPAPGTGFIYLVRASNACGTGTFGAASSGAPRSPMACP